MFKSIKRWSTQNKTKHRHKETHPKLKRLLRMINDDAQHSSHSPKSKKKIENENKKKLREENWNKVQNWCLDSHYFTLYFNCYFTYLFMPWDHHHFSLFQVIHFCYRPVHPSIYPSTILQFKTIIIISRHNDLMQNEMKNFMN